MTENRTQIVVGEVNNISHSEKTASRLPVLCGELAPILSGLFVFRIAHFQKDQID